MLRKSLKKFSSKLSWNLSTSKRQVIEFSATRICPVGCKYCPQPLLSKATNKNLNSKNLNFLSFQKYLRNISNNNLKIMWTGYSEPLLNKEFPEMVNYAFNLGIEQEISTTLTGQERCIDFLCETSAFKKIMLHLPDNNSLMENGFLKVDAIYLKRLKKVLGIFNKKNHPIIKLICFGEDYHPDIKAIIDEKKYSDKLGSNKARKYLGSRSGAINALLPGIIAGKIGSFFISGTRKPVSNFSSFLIKYISPKTNIFYCAYKRLNQPVILGDGKMNICCNDYSLRGIIGDISKKSLSDIYDDWYSSKSNDFIKGKLEPCIDCEYYRVIRLNDIFEFYLKILKKYLKKILHS